LIYYSSTKKQNKGTDSTPHNKDKGKKIKISALIDSGCTHMTIAADTVQQERPLMEKIKTMMEIYNSDGT